MAILLQRFGFLQRLGALLLTASSFVAQASVSGSVELEQRIFQRDSPNSELSRFQTSLRLELEYFGEWNDGDDQLVFEPFVRLNAKDEERTHLDIRQLLWTKLGKNWEFSAGIGHVFWGVTESQHLVDIINQTDGVENIDGEDKLGQPMLHYSYFHKLGNLEAFVLPYFRPSTFVGSDSRLSGGLLVNNDVELYEDSSEENQVDYALRYSNTLGALSLGLSWFDGTSREPDLQRLFDPANFTTTPYYAQIEQFGLDAQITTGAWLLKLEAIQRNFDDPLYEDFAAATIGAEYTLVGIFGSIYDLGLLAEYSWDEREKAATGIFQDDTFVGARLALNDMFDSSILFGISKDNDFSASHAVFIEGSSRIATSMTAQIELRYFDADDPRDLLSRFSNDSFVQLGLEYHF